MSTRTPARTYNQNHIPRRYTSGKRRLSIYWTWSYPWESQRDPAAMENRFSTMTEVRTVLWPAYETPEWSAAQFLQGIAGTLELFPDIPQMNPGLTWIFVIFRSSRKTGVRCRPPPPFHAPGRQAGGLIWPFSLAF